MKYVSTILFSMLILLSASVADAAPDKETMEQRPGTAPVQQERDENREAAVKLYQNFQNEVEPVITQLHSKTLQLRALADHPAVEQATIVRLSDEIAKLHSELRVKWREFMAKCRQILGPDAHKYFKGLKKGRHWAEMPVFPDPALDLELFSDPSWQYFDPEDQQPKQPRKGK